jgi:hypothetical protein
MWCILAVGAALAGSFEGVDSNVIAERTMPVAAEVLYGRLLDLRALQQLIPDDCASDWTFGATSVGLGGTARVTYHAAGMHRRVDAVVSKAEDPRTIDIDHAGQRGFVTRYLLEPDAIGTHVTITTYINAPSWPFRGYYFRNVHPAWEGCHERTLTNLANP